MSSIGPPPARKKKSAFGCQVSAPPTSIVAVAPSGSPMSPRAISSRAAS